jgi:excisionase family DNA binding protein
MKQRLVEAMRAKAKRGEFRFHVPPGFEWDEEGRLQKTADDQVRSAIELIFSRFERLGTIHQAQCSLAEDGVVVPVRSGRRHKVRWAPPHYEHLRRVLTNPMYAGAYCYGRRQVEEILDASHRPVKRTRVRPRQDWPVLIRDHHDAYIPWERFEKIQRQIALNRRAPPSPGAPREGRSLLQGLILCGHCGRRMKVAYSTRGDQVRYRCVGSRQQTGAPVCQRFGALRLERAVERLVLEALAPLGVEAMVEAAAGHARTSEAERAHWRQRVERARYEVDLARRQYDAVDPANRLVARELERRFETALRDLQAIEPQAQARIEALEKPLTSEEQETLRSYAEDLARLWHAPTTRSQDRKRIIRCLIEHVVVTVPKGESNLKAEVHWTGGEVTRSEVLRGQSGIHRYVTDPELIGLVRELATEFSDEQIARILHRKRLRTGTGLPFTARRVTNLRYTHGIPGTASRKLEGDNIHTAEQAAELLGVSRDSVIRWIEAGLLRGSQMTAGAPWRVEVTEQDRRRLIAANVPEGWLSLKAAAGALGLSQQTVLQRLKSGQIEAIRVRVGRRSGWRIRVSPSSYDRQPSLLDNLS